MRKFTKITIISVLLLAVVSFSIWYVYITTNNPIPLAPISITKNGTGKLVDIGNGLKLYAYCSGPVNTKGPTVILDGGMNGTHASWMLVQRELSKFTRTCSYDRAGHGLSDSGPKPRTSKKNADELNKLLDKSNIPGPYVLVGHSFGGMNVRTFAVLYPQNVAGIVLVEAVHEDQRSEMDVLPWPKPKFNDSVREFMQKYFPIWSFLDYKKSYEEYPRKEPYTQEEWDYIVALQTSYKHYMSIGFEAQAISQSSLELKGLNKNLGDKPIFVITAGKDSRIFDENKVYDNDEDITYAKIFTKGKNIMLRLHKNFLEHSTQSKHIIADNSEHGVPDQQPELIVKVILEVLSHL
ncbi:MAG: alpha/beta hydrolase [Alphaproteobacteria bacterium]|nr:alpha/beta hydrolase [Alphaproteobacteria bacterium]